MLKSLGAWKGDSNTPSRFMLRKPELSAGPWATWAYIKALPFLQSKLFEQNAFYTYKVRPT